MNDELTPSERAALRARIVGGAHDIKPVGAHRNARIAGSLAAILVVAIAGGVAATTTLSAPEIATTPSPSPTATAMPVPEPTTTPTPSATPAPEPGVPVVAFDGDCSQMLTDAEVSNLLGSEASMMANQRLSTDSVASLALLGAMSCSWISDSADLTVIVAASTAVDPDLVASTSSVTCSSGQGCTMGRIEGDIWVGAQDTTYAENVETGFTAEEVSAAAARFDRVIALVSSKPHVAPVPTIGSVRPGSWVLSDCAALQGRLEAVTGVPLTTKPFNGNSLISNRLVDRVLVSSARVTTCAYRDADDSRGAITVTLMPGVSTPSPTVPGTFETTVDGATHAWGQVFYDHTYFMNLVAAVGDDRLALDRMTTAPAVTDAERLAAAVIVFVQGR